MLWFNFIPGLKFISFVSNSLSYTTIPQNKGNTIQTKDKIEPQNTHKRKHVMKLVFKGA